MGDGITDTTRNESAMNTSANQSGFEMLTNEAKRFSLQYLVFARSLPVAGLLAYVLLIVGSTSAQEQQPANPIPFAPRTMQVVVDQAQVRQGENVLATFTRGQRVWVSKWDESQQWAMAESLESKKAGWVLLSELGERSIPGASPADIRVLIENRGARLFLQGNLSAAKPELQKLLDICKRVEKGSMDHAIASYNLGEVLLRDEPSVAAEHLAASTKMLSQLLGIEDQFCQRVAVTAVDAMTSVGKLQDAMSYAEDALGITQKQPDASWLSDYYLYMLLRLRGLYEKMVPGPEAGKKYLYGNEFLEQLSRQSSKAHGTDHVFTLVIMQIRAMFLTRLSRYKEAESILVESHRRLGSAGEKVPEAWRVVIEPSSLHNLANVYSNTNRLDKAADIYRQVMKTLPENTIAHDRLNLINNVTAVLEKLGANYESEDLLKEAYEIRKRHFGDDHLQTSVGLESLGDFYARLGEVGTALRYYLRCLKIRQRDAPVETLTFGTYMKISDTCFRMGDFRKAEHYNRQALVVYQKQWGELQFNAVLLRIAVQKSLIVLDRFEESIAMGMETLELCQKEAPENHEILGAAANSIAYAHILAGENSEAIPYLDIELEQARASVEQDDSDTAGFKLATALNNYAMNQVAIGKPRAALSQTEQADGILTKLPLGDHLKSTLILNKGLIELANENFATGYRSIQQSRELDRTYTAKTLPLLPQDAIDEFLATKFEPNLSRVLSLPYHRPDDKLLARLSAGWLINGKAIGQEALAEGALVSSAEVTPKVHELRDTRSRLAKLTSFVQQDPEWRREQMDKIAELESRQELLTSEISRHGLGTRKDNTWVSIGELRDKLPYDSVMVNIARVRINDFAINGSKYLWSDDRYLAWVIPNVGAGDQVSVVDLGLASEIDKQVVALRRELSESAQTIGSKGEKTATSTLNEPLAGLSRRLLEPLKPYIEDQQEIILSPDGQLWLLPWELLRVAEDRYLLEDFRLRYVLSGRELVNRIPARSVVSGPVIFADPDFDKVSNQRASSSHANKEPTFQTRSSASLGNFTRLPGTAREAAAIRPSIESFTNKPVEMLLEGQATEASFKQLRRPRVLIVSSHGFFLNQQGDQSDLVDKDSRELNPLLRCGLALAGCNQRTADPINDGVLSGLEIVGTDLRGTELVVLSACETGLGDIRNGEGVAGLRQAFQLAGAESVVASLWNVADEETARLMNQFFKNLASGMNKSEALRQAQLTRIKARRERNGAAHPFFWAAFTLTGQD